MDSDGEGDDDIQYMLGFAEPAEGPSALLRHRFPSKVGGMPAWLDPLHLPLPQQLTCSLSRQPLQFLLQVYCPRDSNPNLGFHRTLFLFISTQGDQLNRPGAVKVLRCQLPRANPYYDFHPAPEDQQQPTPLQGEQASTAVARDPWQVALSEQGSSPTPAASNCPVLLTPEQELVVEPEPTEEEADVDPGVARVLAEYQARVTTEGEYDDQELPPSMVDELEAGQGPDRAAFAVFQARTALAPEQVLRYCAQPGAAPLWLSTQGTPSPADIPPCPHCGAARTFEFQVMPQLLTFLDVDASDPRAPDWGTIVVYTCPASCDVAAQAGPQGSSAYVEEFAWVQPS